MSAKRRSTVDRLSSTDSEGSEKADKRILGTACRHFCAQLHCGSQDESGAALRQTASIGSMNLASIELSAYRCQLFLQPAEFMGRSRFRFDGFGDSL